MAETKLSFGPGVSELSSLKSVEDSEILSNTEVRYKDGFIYTRSGRLLLAVNPYRQLPLYKTEILEAYKQSLQPQAELPQQLVAVERRRALRHARHVRRWVTRHVLGGQQPHACPD